MYHFLRANVTFSNIFALDQPVRGVTAINDEITTACVLDESIFDFETPPPGYSVEGNFFIVLLFLYRDVSVAQPVSVSIRGAEKWLDLDLWIKLCANLVAYQLKSLFATNILPELTLTFFSGDDGRRLWNEDDELAQLAIQQYLLEDGSDQVTLWEALKSQPDADLQR